MHEELRSTHCRTKRTITSAIPPPPPPPLPPLPPTHRPQPDSRPHRPLHGHAHAIAPKLGTPSANHNTDLRQRATTDDIQLAHIVSTRPSYLAGFGAISSKHTEATAAAAAVRTRTLRTPRDPNTTTRRSSQPSSTHRHLQKNLQVRREPHHPPPKGAEFRYFWQLVCSQSSRFRLFRNVISGISMAGSGSTWPRGQGAGLSRASSLLAADGVKGDQLSACFRRRVTQRLIGLTGGLSLVVAVRTPPTSLRQSVASPERVWEARFSMT